MRLEISKELKDRILDASTEVLEATRVKGDDPGDIPSEYQQNIGDIGEAIAKCGILRMYAVNAVSQGPIDNMALVIGAFVLGVHAGLQASKLQGEAPQVDEITEYLRKQMEGGAPPREEPPKD